MGRRLFYFLLHSCSLVHLMIGTSSHIHNKIDNINFWVVKAQNFPFLCQGIRKLCSHAKTQRNVRPTSLHQELLAKNLAIQNSSGSAASLRTETITNSLYQTNFLYTIFLRKCYEGLVDSLHGKHWWKLSAPSAHVHTAHSLLA